MLALGSCWAPSGARAESAPADRMLVRTRWDVAELAEHGWFARRFTILREYSPPGLFLIRAEADIERTLGNSEIMPRVLYAEPVRRYEGMLLRESADASPRLNFSGVASGVSFGEDEVLVGFLGDGIAEMDPVVRSILWLNPSDEAAQGENERLMGAIAEASGASCLGLKDSGKPFPDSVATLVARSFGAALGEWSGRSPADLPIRIMDLRVVGPSGEASLQAIMDCVEYAAVRGVKVLWIGWGAPHHSRALGDMLEWLGSEAGMTVVVPAGEGPEDGQGLALTPEDSFPSGYRFPNILSVAAAGPTGRLLDQSNYGGRVVHMVAGGLEVATASSGVAGPKAGSALAAGYVAAAAALLKASRPDLTPEEIVSALISSGAEQPYLEGTSISGGLLDLWGALDRANGREVLVLPGYAVTSVGGRVQFRAVGGIGRSTWRLSNPSVGSIDSEGVLHVVTRGRTKVLVENETGMAGSSSYVVAGEACESGGFGRKNSGASIPGPAAAGLVFFIRGRATRRSRQFEKHGGRSSRHSREPTRR